MKELIKNYAYLQYNNDELSVYGQNLVEIINGIETPFYIYLPNRFEDNVKTLQRPLQKYLPKTMIAYAFKANYLGTVLLTAKKLGLGAEIMSLFEYKLAKKVGFSTEKIVVNGPAKSQEELRTYIQEGIKYLNAESLNEIKDIERYSAKFNIKQPVTIRIHPKLSKDTEKRLLIKKNSKLGIDYIRAEKLFNLLEKSKFLSPFGIHVHLTTNLMDMSFYLELFDFLNEYIDMLENRYSISIKTLNLGGGLATRALLEANAVDFNKFAKSIAMSIDKYKDLTFIFEPGRYLVGDSFIAICRVLRTKKSWGRKWCFVDIGANSLIPLRYSMFNVVPLKYKGKGQYTNIGGPLCLPVDIITNESVDFEIDEGDYLAILNCGAYTLSMSEQFGYPRPAVYELNKEGKLILIKQRDSIEQMVSENIGEIG
ncbi:MAG: diaminopimelate decarboxylase family protein [Candidatus Heimdallarchaeaceae archaeon]